MVAILVGEPAAPLDNGAGLTSLSDGVGEDLAAGGKELGPMIQPSVTHAAGRESSANAASLVDDLHLMSVRLKLARRAEPRKPRTQNDRLGHMSRVGPNRGLHPVL